MRVLILLSRKIMDKFVTKFSIIYFVLQQFTVHALVFKLT